MADFDKFDEPRYSTEKTEPERDGLSAQLPDIMGPAKRFLPQIIAVIAIAIIAWFAYDYFIASMVSATITVEDTEGKALNDSSIKIFASGSDEVLFEGSNSPTYSLSLQSGTYRYEAKAPGYSVKKSSFEVSPESNDTTVRLPKEIDVEIVSLEQDFPEKLYVGGETSFSVNLKNNSSSSETIDLVPESDLEDFSLEGMQGITLSGNSTQSVQLKVRVPTSTEVDDEKSGDEKEAALRVKYTNEESRAEFTLYPNPALKITVNQADFSAKARENSNKDQAEIRVSNNNDFPVEYLELSIEITSATKNNPDEVEKWFQFTEIANQPNPQKIAISSIQGDGRVEKELQVIVPLTAKKELDIKGNIVLNAPFLPEPIKNTLTLDIIEEAEYKIELSLSPSSPIEISWDSLVGRYEDKLLSLRIENTGQLSLQNIVISVANSVECSQDWLELIENSVDYLGIGDTKELKLNASAPLAVRNQEIPRYCNLHYRYDNPLQPGSYSEETLSAFIEIVPQPD